MASIEQTQIFDFEYAGDPGETGNLYCQLGVGTVTSGTVFVIKSINVYINGANFTNSGTQQFWLQVSSSSNGTSVANPIFTYNGGTATSSTYNFTTPFYLNQPWLALNANVNITPCKIGMAVTYLQMPGSNPLTSNLFTVTGALPSVIGEATILNPSSLTSPNSAIFNSIIVSNFNDPNTSDSYNFAIGLSNASGVLINLVSGTLTSGNSLSYTSPLYINTQQGTNSPAVALVGTTSTGTVPLVFYASYSVDPYA